MKKPGLLCCALLLLFSLGNASRVAAQRDLGMRPTGSGGRLLPEQAAYDVKFYDIALRVNPDEQTIAGAVTIRALVVQPLEWFVLDLDTPLTVSAVDMLSGAGKMQSSLRYERRGDRIWCAFPMTVQPGATVQVRVTYSGKPRVAPRPPWVGGFVWAKTQSGAPWVSTACQNDGADLWWPCKDHPSDEPDAVALHITIPDGLVCAANGKLQNVTKNKDKTQTYNWYVSTPINNYGVAINIAPYRTVEAKYKSVSGESVPVTFWVLPEDYEKGVQLMPHLLEYLKFFEDHLGPYPFRADKIGIVQTSHMGMEHQTINAYGNNFKMNEYGFDGLMYHELGHEWWGNLVTAYDWHDFWLHEGFESYMDALYAGAMKGEEGYRKYIAGLRSKLRNIQPVAPREPRTTTQMYMLAPDYTRSDGDIYSKGALILHTLRYVLGDKNFFTALRREAYPDPAMEKVKDGKQCRFATTDDFQHIAEGVSGQRLGWFFDLYLRQPKLPRLVVENKGESLMMHWETPDNLPFPMPVDVRVGEPPTQRIEMPQGRATVALGAAGQSFTIDPDHRILKEE